MSETFSQPADEFATNRAEQVGPDVTGSFIVPPFFKRLTIEREQKSLRVRGGRGCGKTMFLRFFSHDSQLSKKRGVIDPSTFRKGIGLYWRTDIGFCDLLKPKWLGDRLADAAFRHHVTLVVLEALCDFLFNLQDAVMAGGAPALLDRKLPGAATYAFSGPNTYRDLKAWAAKGRIELSLWAQNPDRQPPTFQRIDDLLGIIADDLASADERLSNLFFRIFVDEFENLKDNQRRIICDLIKHPQSRFSLNFAMRRDSVDAFWTSGDEQVVDIHDFRTIDLEDELAKEDGEFELMAAELLLMKLRKQGWTIDCPEFDPERLHDPARLTERLHEGYSKAVKAAAREVFPSITAPDVARAIYTQNDQALLNRLAKVAEQGIRRHMATSQLSANDFVFPEAPEASVVAPFILNRAKPGPAVVLANLRDYVKDRDKTNPFTDWIDNNLYGALFHIYMGLPQRANPLYAGFGTFCTLASPNLRFFIEFCHTALRAHSWGKDSIHGVVPRVPVDQQALAARETSDLLLEKVAQLGDHGRLLQRAVRRLGRLFEIAHQRPTQSEPEINHFSIREADKLGLSDQTQQLLRQALTWSVIYEEPDTKNKNESTAVQTDHVPNAIFSPHFGISYRKRRKVLLTATEVNTIFEGADQDFESLLGKYRKHWGGEEVGRSGDLFK